MEYKTEFDFDEKCWCVIEWTSAGESVRHGKVVAKFYHDNAENNANVIAEYMQEEHDELEHLRMQSWLQNDDWHYEYDYA